MAFITTLIASFALLSFIVMQASPMKVIANECSGTPVSERQWQTILRSLNIYVMLGAPKTWPMPYTSLSNKVYVAAYCVLSEAEVSAGKCVACLSLARSEVQYLCSRMSVGKVAIGIDTYEIGPNGSKEITGTLLQCALTYYYPYTEKNSCPIRWP